MVHFVRIELKDIITEVKGPVDEQVANLFLMYGHGKELEQTTVESNMPLMLSRVLAARRHKGQRRRQKTLEV